MASEGGFAGVSVTSGIPAKVWKDPYVVDERRDSTTRRSNGGRLVWDRIFNSNFQLQYTYRKIDLGNEKSGEFLDLSSSQRDRLDREGDRLAEPEGESILDNVLVPVEFNQGHVELIEGCTR